jgi:hypothetical protein
MNIKEVQTDPDRGLFLRKEICVTVPDRGLVGG